MDDNELVSKFVADLEDFESAMSSFHDDFNTFADNYKIKTKTKRPGPNVFHDSFVPELTRSVETLSTTIYRMMTASDPFFDAVALNPDVTSEQLYSVVAMLRYQMDHLEFKRKLLSAIRSCVLFGTTVVENPWVALPFNRPGLPSKATDFLPKSLLQIAFDPMAFDIESSDWIASLDWVTPDKLRMLAKQDIEGTIWNRNTLEEAIEENKDSANLSHKVILRKEQSGYNMRSKNILELALFWRSNPDADNAKDWVFGIINRKHLVRKHPTPFNHGQRPYRIAKYIDFELDPFGLGVGHLGNRALRDINRNRNRISDLIAFGAYNMMKIQRLGGPKRSDMQLRPFGFVEMDSLDAMANIPAQLDAANFGMRLEDMMKDDYRNGTAATLSLQGVATDVTATESAIAQSESIRRVAVLAEVIAERLLRRYLYVSHFNNAQFIKEPTWLRITGKPEPVSVKPDAMNTAVDFLVRLVTDKDFRPERARRMIEFLQVMTTSKSTRTLDENDMNIVRSVEAELARGFGLNPSFFPKRKTAIEQMQESQLAAQETMTSPGMGELMAKFGISSQQPEPSIQTPMGEIPGTP